MKIVGVTMPPLIAMMPLGAPVKLASVMAPFAPNVIAPEADMNVELGGKMACAGLTHGLLTAMLPNEHQTPVARRSDPPGPAPQVQSPFVIGLPAATDSPLCTG